MGLQENHRGSETGTCSMLEHRVRGLQEPVRLAASARPVPHSPRGRQHWGELEHCASLPGAHRGNEHRA